MKHLAHILLLFISQITVAQNMLNNGSFENGMWGKPLNASGTPDMFSNDTLYPGNHFPCNQIGGDHTWGGDTYAFDKTYFMGIACLLYPVTQFNGREYIQAKLHGALIEGHSYKIGFAVKAGSRCHYYCDHIGMYISANAVTPPNTTVLNDVIPVQPQLETTSILADSNTWTLLETTYVATGDEQYVTIGNFYTDSMTQFILGSGYDTSDHCTLREFAAYYFIDSVFVLDLAPNHMNDINKAYSFHVSPNPAHDFLSFEFVSSKDIAPIQITLYDITGRVMKQDKIRYQDKPILFNCHDLPNGQYLYAIMFSSGERRCGHITICR